jgi:protein disulfide-isomerase A1
MVYLFNLFLLGFLFIANSEIAKDGNVLVLDETNFQEALEANEKILVEFYAPWCGHCKKLEPEWKKAATTLQDSAIKIAKVDATEAKNLAQEYGIKGFPTIKYFNKGKVSDYNGGRTEKDIVAWVNKKAGPSAKRISSKAELEKLKEDHEAFVLGVFDSLDSINARSFESLGDSNEDLIFAMTADASLKSALAIAEDTVVVMKSFDDGRADLALGSKFDNAVVESFINGESVPLVQEFTKESASKIFKSPITKHALVFTDKSADHHTSTLALMTEIGAEIKGKALVVSVPFNKDNAKIYEFFGIEKSALPLFIMADMNPSGGGLKKYPYEGELNKAPISSFLNEFFDGKLVPSLKSEDVSPEDTAGDVVVVKGKSFNKIVMDNSNDVLIEFYAPW